MAHDVYPATVRAAWGPSYLRARAFVLDDRLVVYERLGSEVVKVLDHPVEAMEHTSAGMLVAVTPAGTVEVRREGGGCGCGDPLRRLSMAEALA